VKEAGGAVGGGELAGRFGREEGEVVGVALGGEPVGGGEQPLDPALVPARAVASGLPGSRPAGACAQRRGHQGRHRARRRQAPAEVENDFRGDVRRPGGEVVARGEDQAQRPGPAGLGPAGVDEPQGGGRLQLVAQDEQRAREIGEPARGLLGVPGEHLRARRQGGSDLVESRLGEAAGDHRRAPGRAGAGLRRPRTLRVREGRGDAHAATGGSRRRTAGISSGAASRRKP
jgi:hypothetical protein